jgi:Ca2+:H+ antiporter
LSAPGFRPPHLAGGRDALHRHATLKRPPAHRSRDAPCAQLPSGNLFKQLWTELRAILLESKMNILLLLMPFAFISHAVGWPSGATFMLALLPLCALAERLGMITEQLAMYTNDSVGGLLNATFGNATEVIIAAFAISRG